MPKIGKTRAILAAAATLLAAATASVAPMAEAAPPRNVIVKGAIGMKWNELGGPNSPVGNPIANEFCGLRDGGCGQNFERGMIYWSNATGAHFIRGRVLDKFRDHQWERGFLGYPTTDEFCGLRDGGCGQHFQYENASIYWSPASDAHSIQGEIQREWASKGWENSGYRYPVTDEYGESDGGRASDFQRGWITWNPRVGIMGEWHP